MKENTRMRRTSSMGLPRLSGLAAALLLVVALLAACDGQAPPTPVAPTSTAPAPTPTLAVTFTATTQPEATSTPKLPAATPSATAATALPSPTEGASGNPFTRILGPVDAPVGWRVEPCPGDGPFLCVMEGEALVGAPQLNYFPLETHDEFRGMLVDAGLTPGSIDFADAEQASRVSAAFRALVDNYHRSFEQDRVLTHGASKSYVRLPTEEIRIGSFPGIRYGFAVANPDGTVFERWLSYATFDGDNLIIVVGAYFPDDSPGMFRSDADLLKFESYLTRIVEGLKLPEE